MSAIGTKRTCLVAPHMSAIGGKADIKVVHRTCLLLTQSGHQHHQWCASTALIYVNLIW